MELLSGYVENIVFQNSSNGYTVMTLMAKEDEVTCVGTCRGLTKGETIEAEGEFVSHPLYGRQFKIAEYKVIEPKDSAAIERYLASGAIKGVGEALAAQIVKRFGDETLKIIEEQPERLAEIRGIGEKKAMEIGMQVEEKKDLRDALLFLQKYGISNTLAVKIYDAYGLKLYNIIRENPYKLAEDVSGVGFYTADEVARKIGICEDSEYRIRSGIYYMLLQAQGEGHVYLPADVLTQKAMELLGVDEESIQTQIENLMMDKKIVRREEKVFSSMYYYMEYNCARILWELNLKLHDEFRGEDEEKLRKQLEKIAAKNGMELDELQLDAVKECIRSGIFILSGGPGTGKTTTINILIHYFESEGLDIFLAAPTGRAAKRMTEATGFEAKTIHRLLELNKGIGEDNSGRISFERNEDNPLEADVVIIDEMSMVDIQLFYALLKAVAPGTRLILVGDVNQLPSVGPGQVLKDLIESECFPTVVLKRIFRQANESDIVVNAHLINMGKPIKLDNHSKDFFMLNRSNVNLIYKHMIELIRDKLPGYVKASPYDIQVLTPMRKGPLGCETLNGILQRYLNPENPGKKEHLYGDTLFREQDKVMQVKNNYQLEWEITGRYGIAVEKGVGVFNGDMGKILEINEASSTMLVEFDEGRRVQYPFSLLDELELSYAITIHKSQGSEYPAVVMPLLGGPKMLLNRNLLYTGITRAKNCLTILGSSETIRTMIENVSEKRRFTALKDRIAELNLFPRAMSQGDMLACQFGECREVNGIPFHENIVSFNTPQLKLRSKFDTP